MKIDVSLAQLTIDHNNFQKNVDKLLYLIDRLPLRKNHVILLPELWSTGFTSQLEMAADFNEALITELQQISVSQNLTIAGSFISRRTNSGFANRLIVIAPNQQNRPYYDKIHLIESMQEKEWFIAGNTIRTVNLFGIPFGLAICYDLRFPELFRLMSRNSAMIYLLPAQWPQKRITHFHKLLLARAIENQSFMIAANIVGKNGNTLFGGQSMIVNQYGEPILNLHDAADKIGTITIDTAVISDWREKFPALQDRKNLDEMPFLAT